MAPTPTANGIRFWPENTPTKLRPRFFGKAESVRRSSRGVSKSPRVSKPSRARAPPARPGSGRGRGRHCTPTPVPASRRPSPRAFSTHPPARTPDSAPRVGRVWHDALPTKCQSAPTTVKSCQCVSQRTPGPSDTVGGVSSGAMPRRTRTSSRFSAARTRTRPASARLAHPRHLLAPAQVVASPETGLEYRDRAAARARAASARSISPVGSGARRSVPARLCIKVSARIDAWVREAYFGQLLDGHPRAIRRLRRLSARARGRPDPVLPRARVRASRRPAGVPPPHRPRAGPSAQPGARSQASCRCSESCTAARCSTATSRR